MGLHELAQDVIVEALCPEHRRMFKVTGDSTFSGGTGQSVIFGLYLQCGHRVDPPFLPGTAKYLVPRPPVPAIVSLAWEQTVGMPLASLLYNMLHERYDYVDTDWSQLSREELYQSVIPHFPLGAFQPPQVGVILKQLEAVFRFYAGAALSGPLAIESV